MLLAASVVATAACFFTYRYFTTKPVPRVAISESSTDASETLAKVDEVNAEKEEDSPDTTPKQKPQSDKNLMAPPPLPKSSLQAAPPSRGAMAPPPKPTASKPKTNASLRAPPSAASTLRAPPTHTPRPNSAFAPSTSTLPPQSRPSRKVLLAPGHSPLDWAELTRRPPSSTFLRGSDVPPNRLLRVTPSLLKVHTGRKGSTPWGVFGGKVYNMGPYLDFHPGGVPEILKAAGNTQGDRLFREVHPWVSWDNMLGECCVGIMVSEEEGEESLKGKLSMDEMD